MVRREELKEDEEENEEHLPASFTINSAKDFNKLTAFPPSILDAASPSSFANIFNLSALSMYVGSSIYGK
jgi:hypothetical protein